MEDRWKRRLENCPRRLGRVHHYGLWCETALPCFCFLGAHNLTVDQPAGTGLSYTSTNHYVHTLEEVRFLFGLVVLDGP